MAKSHHHQCKLYIYMTLGSGLGWAVWVIVQMMVNGTTNVELLWSVKFIDFYIFKNEHQRYLSYCYSNRFRFKGYWCDPGISGWSLIRNYNPKVWLVSCTRFKMCKWKKLIWKYNLRIWRILWTSPECNLWLFNIFKRALRCLLFLCAVLQILLRGI